MADASLAPGAIALVATSALLHAGWNLLLKRAGGSELVVAMSKVAEAVLFAPFFLLGVTGELPSPGRVLFLTGIAATGVLGNYMALAAAYRRSDLTLVYPVSRGAALLFLPLLGAAFLDERVSARAASGLVVIIVGIGILPLKALSRDALRGLLGGMMTPAMGFAVLAALLTSSYTIWDKVALREMPPFAYMYLYTVIVAVAYSGWVLRRSNAIERRSTWVAHRWAIVGIGVMNMVSYGLTLVALRSEVSSLVIGLRQLSIVAGVALGWLVLREDVEVPRRIGVALIAAGCVLIATR